MTGEQREVPEATRPTGGRAASVFDVARVAGVSHQTVSRVLNDHPNVRASTRQKVLDAMSELSYRPNFAARTLSSSRSRILGILSTSSGEYGPASTIAAVEAAARRRGYSVSIANADGLDPASVAEALDHLGNLSAEGIIVVAPQVGVMDALVATSFTIPYVTTQELGLSAGAGGAATSAGAAAAAASVGAAAAAASAAGAAVAAAGDAGLAVDQVEGARRAVAHLAGLGHRRIGHIAGPSDWIDARSRRAGFERELAARGLSAAAVTAGDWSASSGYLAFGRLAEFDVTAVFSSNDQMALGVLHAAHDAGLGVPRDLSVVGFDDAPEAAHYLPPLTTVRQDFAEIGRLAVDRLLGGSTDAQGTSSETRLVVRHSTASPSR